MSQSVPPSREPPEVLQWYRGYCALLCMLYLFAAVLAGSFLACDVYPRDPAAEAVAGSRLFYWIVAALSVPLAWGPTSRGDPGAGSWAPC